MEILIVATQYTFQITFIGMVLGALYFAIERNNITPEYRDVATMAALICAIAAVQYHTMRSVVDTVPNVNWIETFPTAIRYTDWLLTTPLMVALLPFMLKQKKGATSMIVTVVVADIIMILTGYIGEISINLAGNPTLLSLLMWAISSVAFVFILLCLFAFIGPNIRNTPPPIRRGLLIMRNYITFGWAIYPIAYLIPMFSQIPDLASFLIDPLAAPVTMHSTPIDRGLQAVRELIYNIADLVNKVGFCLAAVMAAKQMSSQSAPDNASAAAHR